MVCVFWPQALGRLVVLVLLEGLSEEATEGILGIASALTCTRHCCPLLTTGLFLQINLVFKLISYCFRAWLPYSDTSSILSAGGILTEGTLGHPVRIEEKGRLVLAVVSAPSISHMTSWCSLCSPQSIGKFYGEVVVERRMNTKPALQRLSRSSWSTAVMGTSGKVRRGVPQ